MGSPFSPGSRFGRRNKSTSFGHGMAERHELITGHTVDGNNSAPLSTASTMYVCDVVAYPLAHPHCNIGEECARVSFDEWKQFCTTLPLTNIAKREGEGERSYTYTALAVCVFWHRFHKWCRIVSIDRRGEAFHCWFLRKGHGAINGRQEH